MIDPAFYQIFSRNNDRDGNPYRLVLLYNINGEVVQAIQYRQVFTETTIQRLYPSAKSLYGVIHLTPTEYNDIRKTFSSVLIEDV